MKVEREFSSEKARLNGNAVFMVLDLLLSRLHSLEPRNGAINFERRMGAAPDRQSDVRKARPNGRRPTIAIS
jgi:hypothetical protein